MPNIKSAKKRMRSNAKKAEVNTFVSASMKTAVKKFEREVKAGNKEEASNNYLSRDVSVMNFIPEKNFNDLKAEIDAIEKKIKEKAFISDNEVVKAKKAKSDFEEYQNQTEDMSKQEIHIYISIQD